MKNCPFLAAKKCYQGWWNLHGIYIGYLEAWCMDREWQRTNQMLNPPKVLEKKPLHWDKKVDLAEPGPLVVERRQPLICTQSWGTVEYPQKWQSCSPCSWFFLVSPATSHWLCWDWTPQGVRFQRISTLSPWTRCLIKPVYRQQPRVRQGCIATASQYHDLWTFQGSACNQQQCGIHSSVQTVRNIS